MAADIELLLADNQPLKSVRSKSLRHPAMCMFHYMRYNCGFEEIRTDMDHRLCAEFLERYTVRTSTPCRNAVCTYWDDPNCCGRCRICGLEKSCVAAIRGLSRHAVVVCPRHVVVVGQRTWIGDISIPKDPEICDVCGQEAEDAKKDGRRENRARTVHHLATEDKRKAREDKGQLMGQQFKELDKAHTISRDLEFQIQYPGMKDKRHSKVASASRRTDLVLNTASTERFLRQLQERRRRYRAEWIEGSSAKVKNL